VQKTLIGQLIHRDEYPAREPLAVISARCGEVRLGLHRGCDDLPPFTLPLSMLSIFYYAYRLRHLRKTTVSWDLLLP
jgi:hypothetical protein